MTVTMSDIAREAGVSRATASYVINGRETSVRISAGTRQRVLDAAQALGYRRNELARAVVTGRSRVLGVLARDPGPEPKARILEGVLEEAGAHHHLVKLLHHPQHERSRDVAARCVEQRLTGLIVIRPSQVALAELRAELEPYGMPMVLVDDSVTQPGAVLIASDDLQGCRLAVGHLAALGHRRVALLEGRREPNPLLREQAFRRAMSGRGLAVPDEHVVYADWDVEKTERAVRDLFGPRPDGPTALLCTAGDFCAAVAVRALRRAGRRVPEDVSVVGYSDLLLAACADPPLTTVAQPFADMGRRAVSRLLAPDGPADGPGDDLLPTQLIVRGSTGPAPTA